MHSQFSHRIFLWVTCLIIFTGTPSLTKAQSLLSNGLIEYDGKIDWNDVDEWVFDANAGDFISIRMAVDEYKDEAPTPYIHLDFHGEILWSDSGNFKFDMNTTLVAPDTGRYHIQIGDVNGVPLLGRIEYILSLARSGGNFSTKEGDQGGPLTNGKRHEGELIRGDSDMWSFEAETGQHISLSVAEIETVGFLSPSLRVFSEDGALVKYKSDNSNSKIYFQAESTGNYTIIIENDNHTAPYSSGSYHLYLTQLPGTFTISDGDEGGALTNRSSTNGTISTGDTDLWTFKADIDDPINIEVTIDGDSNISPYIRVIAPDGSVSADNSNNYSNMVNFIADQVGTYTIAIENGNATAPQLSGDYLLTFTNESSATGFDDYIASYNLIGTQTGFTDDYNNDGISNGLAYAFGLAPNDDSISPSQYAKFVGTQIQPGIKFPLPLVLPKDIALIVEASNNLKENWVPIAERTPLSSDWVSLSSTVFTEYRDPTDGSVTITLENNIEDAPKTFLQLKVVRR